MSSQSHNSAISLVMIVILLGLTSLATVVYSNSPKEQAKVENNIFWHTTRIAFDSALGFLGIVTQASLSSTSSDSQSVSSSSASANKADNNGFWSRTASGVQDAWNSSGNGSPATSTAASKTQIEKFVEWKTLDQGAEIIFRPDKGSEYKFNLPWPFLGNHKTP